MASDGERGAEDYAERIAGKRRRAPYEVPTEIILAIECFLARDTLDLQHIAAAAVLSRATGIGRIDLKTLVIVWGEAMSRWSAIANLGPSFVISYTGVSQPTWQVIDNTPILRIPETILPIKYVRSEDEASAYMRCDGFDVDVSVEWDYDLHFANAAYHSERVVGAYDCSAMVLSLLRRRPDARVFLHNMRQLGSYHDRHSSFAPLFLRTTPDGRLCLASTGSKVYCRAMFSTYNTLFQSTPQAHRLLRLLALHFGSSPRVRINFFKLEPKPHDFQPLHPAALDLYCTRGILLVNSPHWVSTS
jgi:hypothetical protein